MYLNSGLSVLKSLQLKKNEWKPVYEEIDIIIIIIQTKSKTDMKISPGPFRDNYVPIRHGRLS